MLWNWRPEEPTPGTHCAHANASGKWKEKEVGGKEGLQGQELWRLSWNKVEEGSIKCNSQDDTDDYCPGTLHRGTLTRATRCCPTEASKRSPPLPLREGGKAADDSAGKGTAPFWHSQGCSKPRPRSEFCRALQEDKA